MSGRRLWNLSLGVCGSKREEPLDSLSCRGLKESRQAQRVPSRKGSLATLSPPKDAHYLLNEK